ncbi:MAG TPA: phosphate ABC transporter substrate-binding protein [Thermoanaerobaculia bacterium]|nr:phosphate ABC transporter substrate-binding protein [Thermoanaerobaculia bacterium]
MRNRKIAPVALAFALALGGSMAQAQAVKVDSGIPSYSKTSGVSGSLSSVGSDTLNNLMTFWAEGYKKEYPNIRIQIEGKGSTTAPPALIQGTSQLGPMSRTMKAEEIDAFEKKYGYKPTAVRVAVDGIGVFVNKDNPVKCLTMQQLDGIFSQGRACGGKAISKWGDAGVTGNWASQPISLYGRNSASGTYGYFKEHALCKGDYKATVKEQPGSASVVQGVTEDKYAIGYSGIGYKTSGVRAVPVAAKAGPCIDDSPENVITGKYPLSRFLYVYVNKAPNKPFDPLVREFLKYILSQQGQETVVKDGFIPLTSKIVQEELAKLQ